MVVNPDIGCIVIIAYFSIGPSDQADTGSPVTVSKSRPEDKFKPPQGFFHQSLVQQRVPSPLCGKLQQAFHRLCRLDCLLGHISCIMPAAAVWQFYPIMFCVNIHVAESMLARNRITTPFAEQKIYPFPRHLIQNTVSDREPVSGHIPRPDSVLAFLGQL